MRADLLRSLRGMALTEANLARLEQETPSDGLSILSAADRFFHDPNSILTATTEGRLRASRSHRIGTPPWRHGGRPVQCAKRRNSQRHAAATRQSERRRLGGKDGQRIAWLFRCARFEESMKRQGRCLPDVRWCQTAARSMTTLPHSVSLVTG